MKTHTQLMHPECYYHIYNRGINGEQLFKQERNYPYFLNQYAKYIEPVATPYAYVLMGNHFHLLVKLKTEDDIRLHFSQYAEKSIEHIVSLQFSKLFNSYAQAINKQEKRTGGLFEEPFRRIQVSNEAYAAQMVYYIHHNPQKHQFITDFKLYPHSSYAAYIQKGFTRIPRKEVFDWFGSVETFLAYHGETQTFDEDWFENNWVEFD